MEGQKNMAYKAVVTERGVIFLFDNFDKRGLSRSPDINFLAEDIFVEFGNNIVVFTEEICNQLLKTPKVFFVVSKFENYEAMKQVGVLEVDTHAISKIQGAIHVLYHKYGPAYKDAVVCQA